VSSNFRRISFLYLFSSPPERYGFRLNIGILRYNSAVVPLLSKNGRTFPSPILHTGCLISLFAIFDVEAGSLHASLLLIEFSFDVSGTADLNETCHYRGLLVSQLLSLSTTPVVYLYFERL
jgi:hypothetical protein